MANPLAWTLNENNDEVVKFVLTTNQPADGTVLDLTGMQVEVYLKVSKSTSDGDLATWKGTSSPAAGVTITDAPNGKCQAAIPASAVTTSMGWLRVDVLSSGLRKTACYGPVTVTDT